MGIGCGVCIGRAGLAGRLAVLAADFFGQLSFPNVVVGSDFCAAFRAGFRAGFFSCLFTFLPDMMRAVSKTKYKKNDFS